MRHAFCGFVDGPSVESTVTEEEEEAEHAGKDGTCGEGSELGRDEPFEMLETRLLWWPLVEVLSEEKQGRSKHAGAVECILKLNVKLVSMQEFHNCFAKIFLLSAVHSFLLVIYICRFVIRAHMTQRIETISHIFESFAEVIREVNEGIGVRHSRVGRPFMLFKQAFILKHLPGHLSVWCPVGNAWARLPGAHVSVDYSLRHVIKSLRLPDELCYNRIVVVPDLLQVHISDAFQLGATDLVEFQYHAALHH